MARATFKRPASWVEAISIWSSLGGAQEASRIFLTFAPLGFSPRSASTLMSNAATPETIAAAKLVPDARQTPPPTQAPGMSLPEAVTPWLR
jgi:hypothetical protein